MTMSRIHTGPYTGATTMATTTQRWPGPSLRPSGWGWDEEPPVFGEVEESVPDEPTTQFDDVLLEDEDLFQLLHRWAATIDQDWAEYASCKGASLDQFFGNESPECCEACPVMIECRDDALKHDDDGWRGGLSEEQRRLIKGHRAKNNRFLHADMKRAMSHA